jgi:hypothetical protein
VTRGRAGRATVVNQNRIVGEIGIFRHPVLSKLDWDRGRARRWWLPRPHRPFMVRKLSPEGFYKIRDPKNFHAAMRADVELLLSKRAYLSLTTVIMCCLDALAAGSGRATRGKFERFVTKHFHDLCTALESVCPGPQRQWDFVRGIQEWLRASSRTQSQVCHCRGSRTWR